MVFRIVLRNGLLVGRITYEPNRVRANVTINVTHDCHPCETSPVKSDFFLRNGLIVRRITYEPNRVRANVTINITHDYPPCETSPVTPEYQFFRTVLRNGLIVRRITLWARSCSCKRHTFLISLQLFTHFLHPHQATRFSSSSMISFVLKCISHL